MAVAGSLTYDTKIDKNGFEKGLNSLKSTTNTVGGQIKSIVSALGIDKLISASFNIINNSIDGAISRLDTLNNYPKVMSNLGIASDDAKTSINKMSEKLSGLPTTLDEAALAVQRFTSKNSDVNKSTDYFLALNNALLAGGASADIQSSAMEQLSQAYAKGKPDMMEWRSLMTAMPAQLNQVAKAMGYVSTDKLGEDLRNGKISMEKFMDTIVRLNNEGVEGFQSFEEQARNSTGGIATSIKVAKTQIVKGVADIVSAIDETLKNAGLGGISEIIANIGKKSKEVLDKIAKAIKEIDWRTLLNTIKQIVPVIGALVTGFASMKIIDGVNQSIQNTIKGVNGLGKVIQLLMAHPIIAVITAIIALLAVLYQKNENFRNAVNKAFEDIKNALVNSWQTLKPVLEKLWEAIQQIWIALQPLVDLVVKGLIIAVPILAKWITFLISVLTKIITVILNIWTVLINIGTKIINFFKNLVSNIVKFFTETIPNAFQNLKDKIFNIGNSIATFFQNLWNSIVSFFTEGIPNFINSVIQWFQELPYKIGYFIGQILGSIVQFGIDVWNWITVELPQIIQGIIDWFAQLPRKNMGLVIKCYRKH